MDKKRTIRTSAVVQKRAKELRQEMTEVEEILWAELRNRQLENLKFRRQHPLAQYIVDFYCAKHKLIVELDGGIHKQQKEYDAERSRYLEQHGYRVIRFWNHEVENSLSKVLEAIASKCRD